MRLLGDLIIKGPSFELGNLVKSRKDPFHENKFRLTSILESLEY